MAKYSLELTTIGAVNGNTIRGVEYPVMDADGMLSAPIGMILGALDVADSAVANDSDVCP